MKRRVINAAMTGAATLGLVVALGTAATAELSARSGSAGTPDATGAASPAMLAAMQRDLGLTADQAEARLAAAAEATVVEADLQADLGDAYAGSWLTADAGELRVAVADPAEAATVRAAGAVPVVVDRSAADLDQAMAVLNVAADEAPDGVSGWGVDVASNQVVMTAQPDSLDSARGFVADSGVDPASVRVVASTADPRLMFDIRGGDAYFFGGRCSIGHAVVGGFVTAGHCGGQGTQTQGFNGAAQGVVQGSSFPGNDYGFVQVNNNWTPTPRVNGYQTGQDVIVAGGQEAPIGSPICRSGSTTGWHCGTILDKNQTVTYPQGTVFGLTQTNVCAEPGDSGGSWMTGQQAQGVTSGGSGNCTSGGIIFYQPLQEILSVFGLTLVTSGGGTPPSPTATPTQEPPGETTWAPGVAYQVGDQVTYQGVSYRCQIAHTSQSDWIPPNTPALWDDLG